jgi:hypothetical protein
LPSGFWFRRLAARRLRGARFGGSASARLGSLAPRGAVSNPTQQHKAVSVGKQPNRHQHEPESHDRARWCFEFRDFHRDKAADQPKAKNQQRVSRIAQMPQ